MTVDRDPQSWAQRTPANIPYSYCWGVGSGATEDTQHEGSTSRGLSTRHSPEFQLSVLVSIYSLALSRRYYVPILWAVRFQAGLDPYASDNRALCTSQCKQICQTSSLPAALVRVSLQSFARQISSECLRWEGFLSFPLFARSLIMTQFQETPHSHSTKLLQTLGFQLAAMHRDE